MEDPKASLYEETTKDSMSSNLVIINTDQTSWQMRCLVPNCYGNDESVVQYFLHLRAAFRAVTVRALRFCRQQACSQLG